MEKIKSFEINKIYHITLDTSEFEDVEYQLVNDELDTNDLICIHLIDIYLNIESNLIVFCNHLELDNIYYYDTKFYYFYYDRNEKVFMKKWSV